MKIKVYPVGLPGLSKNALRFPPYPAVSSRAYMIHTPMVILGTKRFP